MSSNGRNTPPPSTSPNGTAAHHFVEYSRPVSRLASTAVIGVVLSLSKAFFKLQNTTVIGHEHLINSILHRGDRPLISVANHMSCLDDPTLFSLMPWRSLLDTSKRVRWSLAAQEIVFTNTFNNWFFRHGQTIPLVRGAGVQQPGMTAGLECLSRNEWVHIFSEGKVNQLRTMLRFKWGIGRLIREPAVAPVLLPFWHSGMEKVLPEPELPQEPLTLHQEILKEKNEEGFINPDTVPTHDHAPSFHLSPHSRVPRINQKIVIAFGEPIDTTQWREDVKHMSEIEAREELTHRVMHVMRELQLQAQGKIKHA